MNVGNYINVIVIGGKKRSGKDTLANLLQKRIENSVIMHLADHIRYVCIAAFHVYKLRMTHLLSSKDKPIEALPGKLTGRELLQKTGDFIRSISPSCLVDTLKRNFLLGYSNDYIRTLIVSDQRFQHELDLLSTWKVPNKTLFIKMCRTGKERINDIHSSETEIDAIPDNKYDMVITITEKTSERDLEASLEEKVDEILSLLESKEVNIGASK